jgi:hypothetical protein
LKLACQHAKDPDLTITPAEERYRFVPSGQAQSRDGWTQGPMFTPRYESIGSSGGCVDTLKWGVALKNEDGSSKYTFGPNYEVEVDQSYCGIRIKTRYETRIESLKKLSARALRSMEDRLGLSVGLSWDDDEYGLDYFCHDFNQACGRRKLMLIASVAPVDQTAIKVNLEGDAALFRMYQEALREYEGADVLGMIVRVGNKLFIIHNDFQLPTAATPGLNRAFRPSLTPGEGLVFEAFEDYLDVANQTYGWIK